MPITAKDIQTKLNAMGGSEVDPFFEEQMSKVPIYTDVGLDTRTILQHMKIMEEMRIVAPIIAVSWKSSSKSFNSKTPVANQISSVVDVINMELF